MNNRATTIKCVLVLTIFTFLFLGCKSGPPAPAPEQQKSSAPTGQAELPVKQGNKPPVPQIPEDEMPEAENPMAEEPENPELLMVGTPKYPVDKELPAKSESETKIVEGFVEIKPGSFRMGSPANEKGRKKNEGPINKAIIDKPFMVSKTEVTVGQFKQFVNETGYVTQAEKDGYCFTANGNEKTQGASWKKHGFIQNDLHPVVCLTWMDGVNYFNWLSKKNGYTKCYKDDKAVKGCTGFRYLTEAEWEYAARAGTTTALYNGSLDELACNEDANLTKAAWYCGNSGRMTHPVGQKKPNAWGLFDMLGNVWEWTGDFYFDNYAPDDADDKDEGPEEEDYVVKGCGWGSNGDLCRCAARIGDPADRRFDNLGLRPARSL